MSKNHLPIKRSGWLYLWVGLVSLLLWMDGSGRLSTLETLNISLWSKQLSTNQPIQLLRITDLTLTAKGIERIEQLRLNYPKATIAIISQHANQYTNNFAKTKAHKDKTTTKTGRIPIIYSAATANSLPAITTNKQMIWNSIPSYGDIRWLTQNNFGVAFQPINDSAKLLLLWKSEGQYYPSFITQVLIARYSNNRDSRAIGHHLEANLSSFGLLELSINQHKFTVSSDGSTIPRAASSVSYSADQIEQLIDSSYQGILLFDDLSDASATNIARSLSAVINQQTLNINWLTLTAKLALLFIISFTVFKIQQQPFKRQLIALAVAIPLLILIQSFFVSQSLWMPIHQIILVAIISWVSFSGYQRENRQHINNSNLCNRLLIQTLPYFYESQRIEELLPELQQITPDHNVLKRVYDVAIEAEAAGNLSLASKLHLWNIEHQPNYPASSERLEAIKQQTEQPEDLEQTLVIDANGNKKPTASSHLLNISHFGRYEVLGVLGKGAMGIVFQGVDPKINRHVAVKTLQLSEALDDETVKESTQRFFREAETAGNLSHANIVTIYDVGEQTLDSSRQTLGYIAMDLLTGAPLSEFTKPNKLLPAALVYQLMIQITDALDYAHRQNVIHRDIKPGNIIYDDEQNRGTLTDFGIAYISDHSKTKTGTIMGSPYYMSPEQVLGVPVDGRSDIFSLGVTFYQLLSGELPFDGESIASVAFHITKTKHEPVRNWNKKLPTSATRITNKAMQKDPIKRYQTMQEFKQALINALKRDYKKAPLS